MKKILLAMLSVVCVFSVFSSTVFASENENASLNELNESTYDGNTSPFYVDPDDILEIGVTQENGDIITEENLIDATDSDTIWYDENGNVVEDAVSEYTDGEPTFGVMYLWYMTNNMGYVGNSYGSWTNGVSGSGAATLTLSKSVSTSNTYSGSLTASKKSVSAAVGFDITKSRSTTASYSVKVPKGKKYMIQYRRVYKKYKVQQKAYSTSTYLETKYVYPKKFSHLEYRYKSI
jgi:hypothetical protein